MACDHRMRSMRRFLGSLSIATDITTKKLEVIAMKR
jgi:hypothetical protein